MRGAYRDLEEMMAERGLPVDHTTIYRWGEPLCSGTRQKLPIAWKSQH
jgi:transposase, IS6 family